MRRRTLCLPALLLSTVVALPVWAQAPEARTFRVVVNAENPVNQLRKDQVATLFLERSARWGHGEGAKPVDQSTKAPIREAFSLDILGRSVLAVQSHWLQRINERREVPPPVKTSDAEVLAHVAKAKGGIGYVASGGDLPQGVKALRIAE